nr:chemokine-like receptor 1 [Zootoca vivipara]
MKSTTALTNLPIDNSFPDPTGLPYDYEYDEEAYIFQETLRKRLNIVPMIIYSLAFLLGVIGNGLVIFIAGFRMKRTVNTVWFLNLAIADFAFTFFLPLSIVYLALDFHWPFGLAICKLNFLNLAFLNLYASVYLLMIISIDRFISVFWPVWAQNHRTPRLASFVAFGVWILALVLCSPNLYFRNTAPAHSDPKKTNCYSKYGSLKEHRAMSISRFIFGFVIPFSVIVICYGAIVLKLRRNQLSQSNKPFKVITAVIVAFFVCWIPYHVFSFIELKAHEGVDLSLVLIIGVPLTTSLAFVNSCLNPILYAFMGHDFKERLRYSLFSAFESAFAEDSSQSLVTNKTRSSVELDSQGV